jgi:hypothetical protein
MNQLRPIIDNHISYRSSARTRRSILIVPAPMHYVIRSDKSAVQPIGQVNRPTLRPPESTYNRSYLASCKAVYIIKNHMWRKEKQADTKTNSSSLRIWPCIHQIYAPTHCSRLQQVQQTATQKTGQGLALPFLVYSLSSAQPNRHSHPNQVCFPSFVGTPDILSSSKLPASH